MDEYRDAVDPRLEEGRSRRAAEEGRRARGGVNQTLDEAGRCRSKTDLRFWEDDHAPKSGSAERGCVRHGEDRIERQHYAVVVVHTRVMRIDQAVMVCFAVAVSENVMMTVLVRCLVDVFHRRHREDGEGEGEHGRHGVVTRHCLCILCDRIDRRN
jgi:hypothetical protein